MKSLFPYHSKCTSCLCVWDNSGACLTAHFGVSKVKCFVASRHNDALPCTDELINIFIIDASAAGRGWTNKSFHVFTLRFNYQNFEMREAHKFAHDAKSEKKRKREQIYLWQSVNWKCNEKRKLFKSMGTDSLAGRQAGRDGAGFPVGVEVVAEAEVMINMGRALACLPWPKMAPTTAMAMAATSCSI